MGVELSLYRARIGCYTQPRRVRLAPVPMMRFGRCLLVFAVLTVLLHIGGIEANPGPEELLMDEIRKMKKEIMEELNNIRGDVRSISAKCDNLETVCKHLEEKQIQMADSMRRTEQELVRLDKCTAEHRNSIDDMGESLDNVHRITKSLEEDLDRLEAQSRRDNLRLFGLPEGGDDSYENCASTVLDLLNKNFASKQWTDHDITRAHRVGKQRNRQDPRPMIVRFARWSDTMLILRARDSRDSLRKQNIRISADHTRRQAEQLRDLRSQGKFGIVRGGRVVEIMGREPTNTRRSPPVSTGRTSEGGRNSPQQPVEPTPGREHATATPPRPCTRTRSSAWAARGGAGGSGGGSTRD